MAAPIMDYTGNVVAVVRVSGVEATMKPALLNEYCLLVQEAARNISRRRGCDSGSLMMG